MKRTLSLLIAAVLLLTLVPLAVAEDAPVHIRFVNYWVKEEMTYTYPADLVDAYLAEHPNVTIDWESYSGSDLQTVVFQTQAAANDMPDFFMINSLNMRQAALGGLLDNWDEILASDPEWRDSMLDNWAETTFNGSVYGIPYQFITNEVLYYNKEILSRYGYETYPDNWDEVFALGEQMKADGLVPLAIGNADGWPLWSHLGEILSEYYCGPEWVAAIGGYAPGSTYDTPEFLKVVQLIQRINAELFNPDAVAIKANEEVQSYFFDEDAAALLGGSWTLGGLESIAPDGFMDKVGVAPIPKPNDGLDSIPSGIFTGGSGWEYAINTKLASDQLQVAVDLTKIFTGPEFAKGRLEEGNIPVLKAEYYPEVDASFLTPQRSALSDLISAAPRLTLMNQQQQGSMASVLYKAMQEVQVATKTPEEAVQSIESSYASILQSLE
ncbi:sugar ABC transporter substrate-binding protein [Clostridia bacterium]|nr:sugar ABC transporter substrate-binding protein [Clostridia bacterium]